jgi:hypothetical protein
VSAIEALGALCLAGGVTLIVVCLFYAARQLEDRLVEKIARRVAEMLRAGEETP